MEMLFVGAIFGFVLSSVMFMQKIWRTEERAKEWKARAQFYKRECVKAMSEAEEWKEARCDSSDLFKRF